LCLHATFVLLPTWVRTVPPVFALSSTNPTCTSGSESRRRASFLHICTSPNFIPCWQWAEEGRVHAPQVHDVQIYPGAAAHSRACSLCHNDMPQSWCMRTILGDSSHPLAGKWYLIPPWCPCPGPIPQPVLPILHGGPLNRIDRLLQVDPPRATGCGVTTKEIYAPSLPQALGDKREHPQAC
jgi:hypothetical protein